VLELLPGVPLQPPGLDAPAQFALRALAAAPGAADLGAAGTLIILDGVPLSNNANLQAVGVRGEVVPVASTAGGGIDLRRIPAAAIERVEVIRGIPSVRWGDVTQGAIIVDTRAAAIAPELAGKFDPRTMEANVVGGRAWANDRHAITSTFNLTDTRARRTLSSAATLRGAAQIAHRSITDRYTFDTRADWWRLRYDSPEREDVEPGRNSFQDDQGIRLSERVRRAHRDGAVELVASLDAQHQVTRESRLLARTAVPFTDRLEEGQSVGTFIEGLYDGRYELEGAPRLAYSRLEWTQGTSVHAGGLQVAAARFGGELRREWNAGAGYTFDVARPPQAGNFSGVNGFDRPRKFDDIDPVSTSAVYAEVRLASDWLGLGTELQPGLRMDMLHDGAWWWSAPRSTSVEPRVALQMAPRPWLRLRAGAGRLSKVPTIAQLSPARQYYDVVNVNRYTPDPRERLAVLTTFIRDPRNPDLRHSRATKREVGVDFDGGARWGSLSLTWFNDAVRSAPVIRRTPMSIPRDRYALADTMTGSGQPGRIVEPPVATDPIPIFLDGYVNGAELATHGVEFTITLPRVPALRTFVEVSGARLVSTYRDDERDFGGFSAINDFQLDSTIARLAWFDGAAYRAKRGIITWRIVHHQPELGLVLTGTIQQRVGFERQTLARRDSVSFAGYVTRTGEVVTVPAADRLAPEFADLRRARAGTGSSVRSQPDDWVLSLQVAKSVGRAGRLSFYFYNALDKLATFGGGAVRVLPSSRFGAEVTMPMSELLGRQ
jgi:hypothetical protein